MDRSERWSMTVSVLSIAVYDAWSRLVVSLTDAPIAPVGTNDLTLLSTAIDQVVRKHSWQRRWTVRLAEPQARFGVAGDRAPRTVLG